LKVFFFPPPGNLADNGHFSTKVLWKLNVLKSLLFLVESMQKLAQKKNITCGVRAAPSPTM
jgi:hypothetical protein